MSENTQLKHHIVNLTRLLGKFEPVLDKALVNENNPHGWTGEYKIKENQTGEPTRDQILNTAYAAMGDVKQFIKEHNECKKDLLELREDSIKVHKLLMQAGISTNDMTEGVSIILNRFKQALDVITKASTIESKKLDAFQTSARDFVLRFTRPENVNSQFGTKSGEHKTTPTILEKGVEPEGDAGANQNSSN
jgi:hypothetical protein